MANAAPQSTSSDDTRCHFFRLSLELRDEIYDYVAYEQTSVDLYVNLETPTQPKMYAYDEGRALSRTSSQIRTEYMARLQQRIKKLDIDNRARVVTPLLMPRRAKTTLLIAGRKASRNVLSPVQDEVALRWTIPLEGTFDNGQRQSTLRLTVASGKPRNFNQKIKLAAERTAHESTRDLKSAMTRLQSLEDVADCGPHNWWMSWWRAYDVGILHYQVSLYGDTLGGGYRWIPGEYRAKQ
jgi:hypothetical protein